MCECVTNKSAEMGYIIKNSIEMSCVDEKSTDMGFVTNKSAEMCDMAKFSAS